jgi:pimeloyl-ACP methyl ester carboxylesterase
VIVEKISTTGALGGLTTLSRSFIYFDMPHQVDIRIHGSDSQPTLVYLPGLHGDWTLIGSFRAAVGGHVRFVEIVYPRTPDWSLDDYVSEIQSALLGQGITRGWLLGESFGSQIAWKMIDRSALGPQSLDRPDSENSRPKFTVKGLILAGGFARHPMHWAVRFAYLANRTFPMWTLRLSLRLYAKCTRFRYRKSPESLAGLHEFVERRSLAEDKRAITHRLRLIGQNDLRPIASQTRLPVYYLSGFFDVVVPWLPVRTWLRRNCPGIRDTKIIHLADHTVLTVAPRTAATEILHWLNESAEHVAPTTPFICGTATAKASAPR